MSPKRGAFSDYTIVISPKTWYVLRICHPWDVARWGVCNTPLHWISKNQYVFKINHVPDQLPRPRQRPWFSFAFFSFIKERALPGQGSFSRYIFKIDLTSTSIPQFIFLLLHVPGLLPRPRQRPWFSFAFFSCIKTRKEGRGMGAKPPIFIPQDQYIRKMNRVSIIHRIWISKTWCVFGLYDRYNLKNWRVSHIRHLWDGVR